METNFIDKVFSSKDHLGLTNYSGAGCDVAWFKLFIKHQDKITDAQYWTALRDAWIYGEPCADDRVCVKLLKAKRHGRELLLNDTERTALEALPDTITIWRGCLKNTALRMSWTTSRAVAERFCKEVNMKEHRQDAGHVIEATCKKSDVLAYFLCRGEFEIVIDPKKVTIQ